MTYGTARDRGLGLAAHLGAHLAAATYCPAEQELRWQPRSGRTASEGYPSLAAAGDAAPPTPPPTLSVCLLTDEFAE